MAFMMPVVKNDWDIYNTHRSRRTSENTEKAALGGRVRKVSESRSEGPGSPRPHALSPHALSPHRSAPAMRALAFPRAPPSRASLRAAADSPSKGSASPPAPDKFHARALARADSPERSRCAACVPYL